MIHAFNTLKNILQNVNTKSQYLICLHLIFSFLVTLFDLGLYFLIAADYKDNFIFFNWEFSPPLLIILSIIFISFTRLLLLYSTVITTAFVGTSLHTNLVYSYLQLPYIKFKKEEKGFYINKLSKHVELAIHCLFSCFQLIICALTLTFSAIYVLFNSDFNTLLLISFSAFLFLGISVFTKKKLTIISKNHEDDLNQLMLGNVRLISSFREIFFSQSLHQEISNEERLILKTWMNGSFIAFYSNFSRYILEPVILISAVIFLLRDNSFGEIFRNPAILFSLLRAISVIQTLFGSWANVMAYKGFAFSVCQDIKFSFNKNKSINIDQEKVSLSDNPSNLIELRDITFKYNKNQVILKRLSFCFKSGVNILMGNNGTGKSTLLDIICGLIPPDSGEVYIQGIPIWSNSMLNDEELIKKKKILSSIAYLSQNNFIRNDTILRNITNKNLLENCDRRLLEEVIDIVGIREIIGKDFRFANKMCGENGNLLSGGQRQKLSLARALYQKPSYLFLDESLSAIDEKSRKRILGNLGKLKFIRCTILVSHNNVENNENINKYFLFPSEIKSI